MKKRSPWFIFIALLSSIFITIEATAFQGPALPYISKYFGVSTTYAGVISLAYYLSAIVLAPLMGRLGDQVGRKRMVLIGLGIFSASEFMASLSPTFTIFLIARFIQGLGYACIFPNVFAYISELFPKEKRGRAIGAFMLATYVGAGSGGVISGFLIEIYNWSAIYVTTGTLAAMGFVITALTMPKSVPGKTQSIDYFGGSVFLVTIASLISLPTIISNFGGTSLLTMLLITVGIMGLVALVFIEKRVVNPVIDFNVLKIRGVYLPSMLITLQNVTMATLIYALTFFVAGKPEWSAIEVGLINTTTYGTAAIVSPLIGSVLDKFKPAYFVTFGLCSALVGAFLYGFINTDTSLWYLLMCVAFVGICSGLLNSALMKIVITDTPKAKTGVGTGSFTMFKDLGIPIGSTFGLAVFGTQQSNGIEKALIENASQAGVSSDWMPSILEASKTEVVSPELTTELQKLGINFADILDKATLSGTSLALQNVGHIIVGVLIVIIFISLLLFKKNKKLQIDNGKIIEHDIVS